METSIMMAVDGDLVSPDEFVRGYVGPMNPEVRQKYRTEGFEILLGHGVVGDQTRATKEKGIEYINTLKEFMTRFIKQALKR